jgi:hypothetical protein
MFQKNLFKPFSDRWQLQNIVKTRSSNSHLTAAMSACKPEKIWKSNLSLIIFLADKKAALYFILFAKP